MGTLFLSPASDHVVERHIPPRLFPFPMETYALRMGLRLREGHLHNGRKQHRIAHDNALAGSKIGQNVRDPAGVIGEQPPDVVLIGIVRESKCKEVVALREDRFGYL